MTKTEPDHIDYNPADFNDMTTRDVLERAKRTLWKTAAHDGSRGAMAAKFIQMILDQRGCEEFDPAVTDGELTHLMDIVMFG